MRTKNKSINSTDTSDKTDSDLRQLRETEVEKSVTQLIPRDFEKRWNIDELKGLETTLSTNGLRKFNLNC